MDNKEEFIDLMNQNLEKLKLIYHDMEKSKIAIDDYPKIIEILCSDECSDVRGELIDLLKDPVTVLKNEIMPGLRLPLSFYTHVCFANGYFLKLRVVNPVTITLEDRSIEKNLIDMEYGGESIDVFL